MTHERSLGRIVQWLSLQGVEPADAVSRADVVLQKEGGAARVFIVAVKSLGAWACAAALLFAAFAFKLLDSPSALMVAGFIAVALAVILSRVGRDVFSSNFVTALLAAGQLGLAFAGLGLFSGSWQWPGTCLILLGVGAVAYWPVKSHTLRTMLALGPFLSAWGVVADQSGRDMVYVALGVHLTLLVAFSAVGWRLWLRPLVSAAALSLVLGSGLMAMHVVRGGDYLHMGLLLAASVLVGLVWWFRARGGWIHLTAISALCLLVASLLTFGIQCGMFIVLLGRSLGERWMTLFGLGTMAVFCQQLYESLNLPMLRKSLILLVAGVVLLGLRMVMSHVTKGKGGGEPADRRPPDVGGAGDLPGDMSENPTAKGVGVADAAEASCAVDFAVSVEIVEPADAVETTETAEAREGSAAGPCFASGQGEGA